MSRAKITRGLIATSAWLMLSEGVAAQPVVREIPVVKTWQDLTKQPPILLDKRVKVWLGVEAKKIPRWSGALLYCLTENFKPFGGWHGSPLGPVQYEFSRHPLIKQGTAKGDPREKPYPRNTKPLFTTPLVVDQTGKYHVRVFDVKKQLLAKCTIQATKQFAHPFMPWFYIRHYVDLFKEVPVRGIGFPSWGGISPQHFLTAAEERQGGDLPTYIPAKPTPGFTITVKGDRVHMQSKVLFIVSGSHRRHLVRWWINGKPFVPRQVETFYGGGYREWIISQKHLSLPLRFRADLLGAKKGDRIGLQVLHCQSGWTWSGSNRLRRRGIMQLSNRAEFLAK